MVRFAFFSGNLTIPEEVRRRTKVIGRFPGETSCLSLCWAVLDLVVGGARGLGLTDSERHELLAAVRAERAVLPAPDRMIAQDAPHRGT